MPKQVLTAQYVEINGVDRSVEFMKFALEVDRDDLDTNNFGQEHKTSEKGLFSGKVDWEIVPERTQVFLRELLLMFAAPDDVGFVMRLKSVARADDNLEFAGRIHVSRLPGLLGGTHGQVQKGSGSWNVNGAWSWQASDATTPDPVVVGG